MNRKNVGRDFGGWSEGLLKNNLYKDYDKFKDATLGQDALTAIRLLEAGSKFVSLSYGGWDMHTNIGQSLSTYIDDLKKAVHPAGFQPFGKVTIATLVSAAVTNTAAGVSGYEGDTKTFSPILGSVLETIFSQVLKSRLQVPSTTTHDGQVSLGSRDDKIVQENGVLPGDNLVLNGTDGSSTNAGENIILEDENLLSEDNNIFIVLNGTDDLGSNAGDNITTGSGNVIIGSVDAAAVDSARTLKIAGYDGSTTTTWIDGSSSGVLTFNAANVSQQALTSSSNAVAWDASAKPNAYHLTTENTTFSAPSNNVEGAFICIEINYNGSHTIAFNTVFEFAASTAPTFTSTNGKTDILVFKYNGAVWQEVGRTLNLSES